MLDTTKKITAVTYNGIEWPLVMGTPKSNAAVTLDLNNFFISEADGGIQDDS